MGSDSGLAAVERLHRSMMVDEPWTVRRSRGFTWWSYRLAQHVDASGPKTAPDGALGYTITVRTEVVRNIPRAKAEVARMLVNNVNMMQSMSATVYDQRAGTIDECATILVHDDTLEVWCPTLAVASVLQNTAAHSRAHALAEALDGEPATSTHPSHGVRPVMDDLLNGPAAWATEAGQQPSRFMGEPLLALQRFGIDWSMCTGDEGGFTGEVPYSGDRCAAELLAAGIEGERETALVRMFVDQPHPQLGSGLLLRMQLPISMTEERAVAAAARLNADEASGEASCKLLGAWCEADGELNFVSFLPSMMARPGLLENLYVDCAVRSKWAFGLLGA